MSESVSVAEVKWTYRDSWSGPEDNGYTYHVDLKTAYTYIDDYWKTMPDEVPEEYNSPGKVEWVSVNPVFALLVAGKGTIKTNEKIT